MNNMHRRSFLIRFEREMAKLYEAKKIRAPIHLSSGNEEALIKIFKSVKSKDWIFSTWRSHYHWLLSGRSQVDLKRQIIDGYSMHVFGDRFFTSAIVGGIAPIAVGTAWALKKKRSASKVWCFLGDMAASTGIAMESIKYACGNALPITFVIEDNGLSVKTDTLESWGCKRCKKGVLCLLRAGKIMYYNYTIRYPHAGTGTFVLF